MAAFLAATKALKAKNLNGSIENEGSSIHQTMTIQSATSTNRLDCPFNLDEIFQADVDRFSTLRDVIKFIMEKLEKSFVKSHELETKMISKFMQIDK